MTTLYDEVAYPGWPYPQTHPLRTSAVAALLGLPYAPPATARVLEIGCGDAANLIPMALTSPEAQFMGFDLAEAPIARGRALADALGLENLRLEARDILAEADDLGPFDYVIAHGVYSWVPDPVRERLLDLVGERLSPAGIAFVSYNALPGGRMREAMRDLLLFHLGAGPHGPEAMGRVREVLQTFVRAADATSPLAAALRAEAEAMLGRDPAVVFHDELCEHWRAFHLHEFAAAAGAHGLEVIGDVEGAAMRQDLFPTALGQALRELAGGDGARFRQYQDFVVGRLFHQSLLRRAGGPPPSHRFEADRVRRLWAGASVKPEPRVEGDGPGEVRFRFSAQHMIKVAEPELQAVLRRLGEAWPQLVPIASLPGAETPEALAQLFTAGRVELQTGPWPGLGDVCARPQASALARLQIARGLAHVTALDMSSIRLEDETGRVFLSLLDGTRDAAGLAEAVSAATAAPVADIAPGVEPHLRQLAGMGLLAG
jgi:trans-aconitate methyltransferase